MAQPWFSHVRPAPKAPRARGSSLGLVPGACTPSRAAGMHRCGATAASDHVALPCGLRVALAIAPPEVFR